MITSKTRIDSALFISNFQARDELSLSLYLRTIFKDLSYENKLSKITFSEYLKIPYFLSNRIFERYTKQFSLYIEEEDFYDFMKSIYLVGYSDIIESIYKLLDPQELGKVNTKEINFLLYYFVDSKDTGVTENISKLVRETFNSEEYISCWDFSFATENVCSGIFLTIFNYFLSRKPFSDIGLKHIIKPSTSFSDGSPVKSKFSKTFEFRQSLICYPSDIAITILDKDLVRSLDLSKHIQDQEVNCHIYEPVSSRSNFLNDSSSDDEVEDIWDDINTVNLIPDSLKLKNCFSNNSSNKLKHTYLSKNTTNIGNRLFFEPGSKSNNNYFNNIIGDSGNETKWLHGEKVSPMGKDLNFHEKNLRNESTAISGLLNSNLLYENKFFIPSRLNAESIIVENYIFKFNKKRNKIKSFWIVIIGRDVLYFTDPSKTKFKGIHNLTETFLLNEIPLTDQIKKQKVWYIQLQMRERVKTFYFPDMKSGLDWIQEFKKILSHRNLNDFYALEEDFNKNGTYENLILENKTQIIQGYNKQTNEKVCVKILRKFENKKSRYIKNEIDISYFCNHANIVKYYDIFEDSEQVYIVMEYMNQDNLTKFLIAEGRNLTIKQIMGVVKQIASGLKYLHQVGVVHRDIKPDNIGISIDNKGLISAKIMDFGLSTINGESEMLSEPCGTIFFCAPEIFRGRYNNRVDVWSYGVVLCYVFYGKLPFKSSSDCEEFKEKLKNFNVELFLSDYDYEYFKELIRRCLVKNYKIRSSIDDIILLLSEFSVD